MTFINSKIALQYPPPGKGRPPAGIGSWSLPALREQIVRSDEGGFVGRAPSLPRAAFEPLTS
jgi:hypothetical protein